MNSLQADLAEAQRLYSEMVREGDKTADLLKRAPWDQDEKRVLRNQINAAGRRAEELMDRILELQELAARPLVPRWRCSYCGGESDDTQSTCSGCGASEWEAAA